MASKRMRGSPTGQTPKKPPKIRHVKTSKGNRKLDFDQTQDQESFIDEVVGAECCETVGTVECPFTSQASSNTSKQVNVLSTHEVMNYVIPSFSIVSMKLRRAKVTFGTSSEQVDVFVSENTACLPDKVPFSIEVEKMCTVEVTEFNKAVEGAQTLNLVDDHVIVIGKWTTLCPQENWSDSFQSDNSPSCSPHDSDAEEDSAARGTHTVVFKVIGCITEPRYQYILEKARDLMEQGQSVCVKLSPEPDNTFDPKAIAFLCKVDEKYERVGYVVREVQDAVHVALGANDIIDVSFKWIKYITDWYRSGPGYFAGVYVTKNGVWPHHVVRAMSTR